MTMSAISNEHVARPPRVLWLCGMSPHGVTSGLAMYTTGLTEALAAHGVDVHGLALGRRPDSTSKTRWTIVDDEPLSRQRSLPSRLPHIAARLATSGHLEAVDGALGDGVDVVVVDHLMSAWCLDRLATWRRETGGVLVHVSHNHEGLVRSSWASSVSRRSVQGIYLRFDAARIRRLERRLFEESDLVTAITLDDRRSMAHVVEFERSMVLPPGWSAREQQPSVALADRPRRVAILGSFDWQAKRDNLEQVVAALDPVLHRSEVELVVIGGGDDEFLAAQSSRWAATTFLGHVADADRVLADCRLGIVAEPVGGGFKLKALDYGFSGLPMAVLAGSMAGLDLEPGRDIVVADDLAGLAVAIVAAVNEPESLAAMATSTRRHLDGRFDWSDRGRLLADRLVELTNTRSDPHAPSASSTESDIT